MNYQLTKVTDKDESFLRRFNLIAGILHLLQGTFMFFVSKNISREVFISLPKPDIQTMRAFPQFENFFEVSLGPVVAAFLLLSALAHFLLITPSINTWYNNNLRQNINVARWYEYALSSSLMLIVVGILSSVVDFNILILIFALNTCMNLFGLSMEKYNSVNKQLHPEAKTDWSNYIFGVIAGLTPWVIVGLYFFTTIDRVEVQAGRDIPGFVKYIFYTLIITFNTFAINMFLQYKKIGPWKNYLFGEKMYIVLSLVAKTILAWQIWGGTLR
jgi:hypothetical protein